MGGGGLVAGGCLPVPFAPMLAITPILAFPLRGKGRPHPRPLSLRERGVGLSPPVYPRMSTNGARMDFLVPPPPLREGVGGWGVGGWRGFPRAVCPHPGHHPHPSLPPEGEGTRRPHAGLPPEGEGGGGGGGGGGPHPRPLSLRERGVGLPPPGLSTNVH